MHAQKTINKGLRYVISASHKMQKHTKQKKNPINLDAFICQILFMQLSSLYCHQIVNEKLVANLCLFHLVIPFLLFFITHKFFSFVPFLKNSE